MLKVLFFLISFFVECDAAPTLKDLIVESLKGDISQKITATDFDVVLSNWSVLWEPKDFTSDPEPHKKLRLDGLNIEDNQRRFTVDFKWSDFASKKIYGTIEWLVSVPVLKTPIMPGTIIQETDIAWQKYKADRLTSNMLTKISDLVGKTSNGQALKVGVPLHSTDVMAPILVKRGAHVQITYKSPSLVISSVAVAKNQGSLGEVITLETSQNKSIQAKIVGPNQAEVQRGL